MLFDGIKKHLPSHMMALKEYNGGEILDKLWLSCYNPFGIENHYQKE